MKPWTVLLALFLMIVAAGCGKGEEEPVSGNDSQPATLKFAVHLPINDEFRRLYIEPVGEKYPHITLELFSANSFTAYEQLIVAGDIPDIYISFNGNMPGLKDRGFNMDMKPIFQANQVDLSRFGQNYLDDIQYAVTEEGELYGLPIETGFHALYYNIDIFDKFGVPYPTDGMIMEDALELAKRLTRFDDGVQYRGWDLGSIVRMAQPLGLVYLDPITEKAVTSNEGWKRVFELGLSIYSIPGNQPSDQSSKNRVNGFITDRSIAMLKETNIFSRLKEAEMTGLNWDVVQHPYYADVPNIHGNATVYMVGAVPTTSYMDQVLQVIEVLTSDEVQMNVSKSGRVSPLNNEDVQQAFGQDDPSLQAKNVAGIVKSKPVQYPIYLYREIAEPLTNRKFNDIVKSGEDVNTALRTLDEEINLAVQANKMQ